MGSYTSTNQTYQREFASKSKCELPEPDREAQRSNQLKEHRIELLPLLDPPKTHKHQWGPTFLSWLVMLITSPSGVSHLLANTPQRKIRRRKNCKIEDI